MNVTLVCEESFEGIMTAVYDGWVLMNQGHQVSIHPGTGYTPSFFSEFMTIETNVKKAEKVAKSIQVKVSMEAYTMVFRACMHYADDRADAVFNFLKVAYPAGARVVKMLGNPAVMRVTELSRKVANETHMFKEFVRFTELKGNVLFSKIEPKCDVLLLLSYHFQQRFPEEKWIIYDTKRIKASVHPVKGECILIKDRNMEELTKGMQNGQEYEALWQVFFDTIGIEERYNPKCQRTMMPLWYRKNATEFTRKQ
ncbi:MAG: TIGR03915 family putative DNA repair protein [Eubacterium sp.]